MVVQHTTWGKTLLRDLRAHGDLCRSASGADAAGKNGRSFVVPRWLARLSGWLFGWRLNVTKLTQEE
jgi:hypothetical protein